MESEKFGRRLDKPENLDKLAPGERVQRLQHQLSIIYDRVFLTGDWEGEYTDSPRRRTDESDVDSSAASVFEDRASITDPKILADDLSTFLVAETLRARQDPASDPMKVIKAAHDSNRALFFMVTILTRDMLREMTDEVLLGIEKCFDENIHYFRDVSVRAKLPGGIKEFRQTSTSEDEERAREGLLTILARLRGVAAEK